MQAKSFWEGCWCGCWHRMKGGLNVSGFNPHVPSLPFSFHVGIGIDANEVSRERTARPEYYESEAGWCLSATVKKDSTVCIFQVLLGNLSPSHVSVCLCHQIYHSSGIADVWDVRGIQKTNFWLTHRISEKDGYSLNILMSFTLIDK